MRCDWCGADPIYVAYHDQEWGVPQRDEHALWVKLVLEGFQAGLSWLTILRRRAQMIEALDGLEPAVVAGYTAADVDRRLADPRLIRHRGKIVATVSNARALLRMRERGESLAALLWSFAPFPEGRVDRQSAADIPTRSEASTAMARALKARGFSFIGPTSAYALMQATGMVNDHITACFRHAQVARMRRAAWRDRRDIGYSRH